MKRERKQIPSVLGIGRRKKERGIIPNFDLKPIFFSSPERSRKRKKRKKSTLPNSSLRKDLTGYIPEARQTAARHRERIPQISFLTDLSLFHPKLRKLFKVKNSVPQVIAHVHIHTNYNPHAICQSTSLEPFRQICAVCDRTRPAQVTLAFRKLPHLHPPR